MKGDEFIEMVASQQGWGELGPDKHEVIRGFLSAEKAVRFRDHWVLNSFVPPYPSQAFDRFFRRINGGGGEGPLFSVSLAVTNRCEFGCLHCCNAGRSQQDLSLSVLKRLARELQDLGAVLVALTGGEPLLRDDLEDICRSFDDRCNLLVNTTGWGLSQDRARRLKDCGVFTVSVSLDSDVEEEHDRLRGRRGAFREALRALEAARKAGLFPYVMTMVRSDLLPYERFMSLLRLTAEAGAMELRFIEPVPIGRAAGQKHMTITGHERQIAFLYQREVAARDDLPIFSVSSYHTTRESFGCSAGRRHIYIDGSGEVCPCNHVPLSFGNVRREPLRESLKRMDRCFPKPRSICAGRILARRIPAGPLPTSPKVSADLCRTYLSHGRTEPEYYRLMVAAKEDRTARKPPTATVELAEATPPETAEATPPETYVSDRPTSHKGVRRGAATL